MAIIKSLLILVFWKDPVDKSAWIKIGTAIRLGYQLGLHISASRKGEDAETRDARRTWFCESSGLTCLGFRLMAGLSCA